MPTPLPEPTLQAMLTQALARYRRHPDDYTEGVVVGLMRMLVLEPDRSWCDDARQSANAAGQQPTARARDYLNGVKAAMAYSEGTTATSPLAPGDAP